MSNSPTTPTTDLTYGTYVRDNDPRRPARVLQVTGFEEGYVFASRRSGLPNKLVRIRRERIYLDRKPRRAGWSLVQ